MTREAVMEGFERFVGDAIEQTAAEFSVSRALRQGIRGPGGATIDKLLKNSDLLWENVVRPELEVYREQTVDQFEIVLDYAESDQDIEQYRRQILDAGSFAGAIRQDLPRDRRQTVEDCLLAHHRELGNAVEPLLETSETEFWAAARAVLTPEQSRTLIEEHFAFTDPIREHRNAFQMVTAVDVGSLIGGIGGLLSPGSIDIEYTDEAIRAMCRAEQAVIDDAKTELERRFDC